MELPLTARPLYTSNDAKPLTLESSKRQCTYKSEESHIGHCMAYQYEGFPHTSLGVINDARVRGTTRIDQIIESDKKTEAHSVAAG